MRVSFGLIADRYWLYIITALVNLANKAICIWRERPVPGPVVEPWHIDVPAAVDDFLRCVRYRFPIVKLDDRNGFCHEEENERSPYSWVDEYSTLEHFDFNPKAAAVLHLNWQASIPTLPTVSLYIYFFIFLKKKKTK